MRDNLFYTRSVTLATWFEYARLLNLRLNRYDPATQQFIFWDPDNVAQAIVEGHHRIDPEVKLYQFEKIRRRIAREKHRADLAYKAVRRG